MKVDKCIICRKNNNILLEFPFQGCNCDCGYKIHYECLLKWSRKMSFL